MNKVATSSLKFIGYILGKILACGIAILVAWLVFTAALNTMNIRVMVKDAFELRASAILSPVDNADKELLHTVFTQDYLLKSGLDTQMDNQYYAVSSYDQHTDVQFKIVSGSAKRVVLEVTDVVERVRATITNESAEEFVEKESLMDSGIYEVTVVKTDTGWVIENLELIEEVTPEHVVPLPTLPPEVEVDNEEIEDSEEPTGEEQLDGEEE